MIEVSAVLTQPVRGNPLRPGGFAPVLEAMNFSATLHRGLMTITVSMSSRTATGVKTKTSEQRFTPPTSVNMHNFKELLPTFIAVSLNGLYDADKVILALEVT